MNDFSSFSPRLRSLIKENKLTQVELSKKLGISKYALNNYVNGTRLPETTILYSLSSFFGKSMEWLLTGEENFTNVQQKSETVFDPATRDMIDAVKLMMNDPDPDIRAWAKIQFRRTFADYLNAAAEKKEHA